MRWRANLGTAGLTAAVALAALYPVVAQRSPQSILPPGFGEPEPAANASTPKAAPGDPKPLTEPAAEPLPTPTDDAPESTTLSAELSNNAQDNALLMAEPVDLPDAARRSVDGVGLLATTDGGLPATTFGDSDGRFLTGVMRRMRAPVASRWASILLRRTLLSKTDTPVGVSGPDWVAERAWLLVRMGEADNARALVHGIDPDNYTPWLNTIAMQAALATADPAALCGIADAAAVTNAEPSWLLARAMCAGLSGEGGTASSLVDQSRARRKSSGIDALLAEKVAGVGSNTRRAITIQWDGVDQLTAWRYGLATATGVAIPERLMTTVGPQVRAWQARAPLLDPVARTAAADRAATLGVFSSAALVDFYSALFDNSDPSERTGTTGALLRSAYAGEPSSRLSALDTLFDSDNPLQSYARLILGARAAAMIAPEDGAQAADSLLAAMMSAGLDVQAARWSGTAQAGSLGWGLLAVGAPRAPFAINSSGVGSFGSTGGGEGELRTRFLFAALAGLGRLPLDEVQGMATDYAVPIGRETAWTRALDRAVAARQAGTVALLCAAGMQTTDWRRVPPAHLYRIIAALRAVGFEPEARMIAAEALTRS